MARGDYHSTSKYLQKAYDAFLEAGFKLGLAYVMASRGELCWLEGNLRKAGEALSQGLALCREARIQDEIYSQSLLLLAAVQTDRRNFSEAEDLLNICTALNEQLESDSLAAEIYFGRGYLKPPRNSLSNAKAGYKKALEIAEGLKLIQIWIKSSLGLVEVAIAESLASSDESRLREAEECLLTIFERAEKGGQIPILYQVTQLQGLLAIAKNNLGEALSYFNEAYEIAEKQRLIYLAERAREKYERARQLQFKSQELSSSSNESSVQDVLRYSKDRIREVQRALRAR